MARVPYPPAPFTSSTSGDFNQRLAQVADAINRKADTTATPSFSSIILQAPDRSTWRVSVTAAGALVTEQVGP